MSVGKAPPLTALIQALRAQSTARTGGARGKSRQDAVDGAVPIGAGAAGEAAFRARLSELVVGVDPDDPTQLAPLKPVLLQVMLRRGLGEEILRHPELPHLLQRLDQLIDVAEEGGRWPALVRYLQGRA